MAKFGIGVLIILFVAAALATVGAQSPAIRTEQAWMRQPPKSSTTAAGYGLIINDTDRLITIVSGASKLAKTVELHQMSMHGDMMHMRPLEKLSVPARGRVALTPGGTHLMLFGLRGPLALGAHIDITLRTSDGQEIPLTLEVRAAESAP